MPVEGVVAGAAAAILAGLQPLQGTWSLGLSFKIFLFIHNDPKGERKRERNPLPQWGGWIMWKKKANQLCGKPHLPLPPAPTVIKNRILDRCLWFSSAHVNWKYGRKYLIEYKINASFSQFKKKLGEEGRPKGAIEMYACIKINRTLCDPHTWFTAPEVVEVGGLTNRVQVCVSFETDKASRRDSASGGLECCHTSRLTAMKSFRFWNGYTDMIFSHFVNLSSFRFGNTAEHSPSNLSYGGRVEYQWGS